MNRRESIDKTVRQYLLGELSEPEQAAIETEYFANEERFEEVSAFENDLIDDYVRGDLSTQEREQFERRYLSSPEKLRRVEFAVTMQRSLYGSEGAAGARAPRSALEPGGFRRAVAAMAHRWSFARTPFMASLALVLVVAVLLLAFENLRLRRLLTRSEQGAAQQSQREQEMERQLAEQRATAYQLSRDLDALRAQPPSEQTNSPKGRAPAIASFVLRPGLIRGTDEPQTLLVPPGAEVIELRLGLRSSDFKKYTASLLTPEGITLWRQTGVRVRLSQAAAVFIRVPAKVVPPGDYLLRVDGTNPAGETSEVADSYFRVAKKTPQ